MNKFIRTYGCGIFGPKSPKRYRRSVNGRPYASDPVEQVFAGERMYGVQVV